MINFIKWLKQKVIMSRAGKVDAMTERKKQVGIISETEDWHEY